MPLVPGYGDTPVPEDELAALLPHVHETLAKPITRAAIYDLEMSVLQDVTANLMASAARHSLGLDNLLDEYFLRDLHTQLYGDIWTWAGRWRLHEVNIGVAPENIAVELVRGCSRHQDDHRTDAGMRFGTDSAQPLHRTRWITSHCGRSTTTIVTNRQSS